MDVVRAKFRALLMPILVNILNVCGSDITL